MTFVFDGNHNILEEVTPVKYEGDIHQVKWVLEMVKNWENNGKEQISLVTPTTGWDPRESSSQTKKV